MYLKVQEVATKKAQRRVGWNAQRGDNSTDNRNVYLKSKAMIFIEGNFKTNMGGCCYHCSPTCHPCQVDPDKWHYGCLHKAWPQNKRGDFVPFVDCEGVKENCDLKQHPKLISRYLRGKKLSLKYMEEKIKNINKDIHEIRELEGEI